MNHPLIPSRVDLDMELTDKLVRQLSEKWSTNSHSEWMATVKAYAVMRQCELGTALLGRLEALEERVNEIATFMNADRLERENEEDDDPSEIMEEALDEALDEALVAILRMKKGRR